MPAGYSGTPLIKKLGIKSGYTIAILNPPADYDQTLGELPHDVTQADTLNETLDFVHFFTKDRAELEAEFPHLKAALKPNGMLWVSWPKKASKVPTDVSDSVVRDIGLANGLVDVKVAAIDATWSGLKFVYRLQDRPA
jgi:hypothetical protein